MGGTPAFTEKGKALGLSIIRLPKGGGMMAMRSIQPVILPAEDVMEIAEQAIQSAKEEDEKTESADEEAELFCRPREIPIYEGTISTVVLPT